MSFTPRIAEKIRRIKSDFTYTLKIEIMKRACKSLYTQVDDYVASPMWKNIKL